MNCGGIDMNEQINRALRTVKDFEALTQLEDNVRKRGVFDDEVAAMFKGRAADLARDMIARRTELDLNSLTPAEEKIIHAVSAYLAIKRRSGGDASYTLRQLRNRGLIESAEAAVSKSKPTQGFETLRDEDLGELSYEQIVIDHPEEFSARALWYARRTLGLPNNSDKPPVRRSIPVQIRTEELLGWLAGRAAENGGAIEPFANAEAANMLGMTDMARHGRVYGNIQSRLDFACYRLDLPPLGLTATVPFSDAWGRENRAWGFPVLSMQEAARSFRWREHDFEALTAMTHMLAGQAYLLWKGELRDNQASVKAWAEGLGQGPRESVSPKSGEQKKPQLSHNPNWTREEHILGLDLYLRLRGTSYPDEHPEVIELSLTLLKLAALRKINGAATFRNANGVSMKMLNFRRVDPEYTGVGLPSGSKLEGEVWKELANAPEKLAVLVGSILDEISASENMPDSVGALHTGIDPSDYDAAAIGESPEQPPSDLDRLAALERRFLDAAPEVKVRISKGIERGPIGREIKRLNGFRCQICKAFGYEPLGFRKKDGEPYVEAHHVMPVSRQEIGSLSAANIVTLCANHHRELHYGDANVTIGETEFTFIIAGRPVVIPRVKVDSPPIWDWEMDGDDERSPV
jgi:predicted HNH restriction endonuclease